MLSKGMAAVGHANTGILWLAAAGFVVSIVASASTWRTTLEGCGARLDSKDACARYGVGSLVNTFLPLRLGDAARVALFSRTLRQERGQTLTTGGALAAIGLARAVVQATLLAVAAGIGALPLWPVAALLGLAAGGAVTAVLVRGRLRGRRIARLTDAFHSLARSPRRTVRLLGWTTVAAVARVVAATAVVASLGGHWSLGTGVIVTAVLDLAVLIPLTPGSLGITSGAVALALRARGISLTTAVAAGLAFHAVEAAAGLGLGVLGALYLARYRSPGARRWSLGLAGGVCALLAVAGAGGPFLAHAA